MAATLAEPVVLAAAKDYLYPDFDTAPNRYAVTDTQFTVDAWGDWTIPTDIHERLLPFNTIQLASGQPDLLGVGMPDTPVLNADGASTPVVAVEAKGHNTDPTNADATRGIEQVHARLSQVNLGYVATPAVSVTETARSLARDLNVGILGVHDDETVDVLEPARVTGAGDFTTGIEAIRFQARTHQLTEGSFPVNHPKNFLGYALAVAADGQTEEVYADHVIQAVSGGRRGAILLGLVDPSTGQERLTQRGAEVVRFAHQHHGGVGPALEQFDTWTGKRTRFTQLAPKWAQLARSVTMQYDPTGLIVDALERLHADGVRAATLPELVAEACAVNQPLAVEVFFTRKRRDDVLTSDGDLDESVLDDPAVYKSGAYFQFKAQLYHTGIITEGGTDDGVAALSDPWRLEQPIGPNGRL